MKYRLKFSGIDYCNSCGAMLEKCKCGQHNYTDDSDRPGFSTGW